jgi:hypothetical protein
MEGGSGIDAGKAVVRLLVGEQTLTAKIGRDATAEVEAQVVGVPLAGLEGPGAAGEVDRDDGEVEARTDPSGGELGFGQRGTVGWGLLGALADQGSDGRLLAEGDPERAVPPLDPAHDGAGEHMREGAGRHSARSVVNGEERRRSPHPPSPPSARFRRNGPGVQPIVRPSDRAQALRPQGDRDNPAVSAATTDD